MKIAEPDTSDEVRDAQIGDGFENSEPEINVAQPVGDEITPSQIRRRRVCDHASLSGTI